jgi:hypothetical protein
VSPTPLANHVVAAVSFLRRYRAGRARRGVELDVVQGSFVLGAELASLPRWATQYVLAVPSLEAAAAESEQTVFANTKEASTIWWLGRINGC